MFVPNSDGMGMPNTSGGVPLILYASHERGPFSDLVGLLTAAGWVMAEGFRPPQGDPVVCFGLVDDWSDAAAAVACAAAGAGVVAWARDERVRLSLFEDLRHLGDVLLLDHDGVRAAAGPETLELLRLYGGGSSLVQAARRLHLSERTARRRMAALRRLLGVRSNEQAVARLLAGQSHPGGS